VIFTDVILVIFGIKLIQSIEGNELVLSTWSNIHRMDLTVSNQAGLIIKLPAVIALGNRSIILPFHHERIWLIQSDLISLQEIRVHSSMPIYSLVPETDEYNSNYIRQNPKPTNIVYVHRFGPGTDEYMSRPV
jgi:hypothetical protein